MRTVEDWRQSRSSLANVELPALDRRQHYTSCKSDGLRRQFIVQGRRRTVSLRGAKVNTEGGRFSGRSDNAGPVESSDDPQDSSLGGRWSMAHRLGGVGTLLARILPMPVAESPRIQPTALAFDAGILANSAARMETVPRSWSHGCSSNPQIPRPTQIRKKSRDIRKVHP
jgi:hypothetical protein